MLPNYRKLHFTTLTSNYILFVKFALQYNSILMWYNSSTELCINRKTTNILLLHQFFPSPKCYPSTGALSAPVRSMHFMCRRAPHTQPI